MFNLDNLDEREKVIFADVDEWYATRFEGRGVYTKLGPFKTQDEVVNEVKEFFSQDTSDSSKPFAIYAASTKHGHAHVIVGTLKRDGTTGKTHREVSQEIREAKALVAKQRKSSRRANT